MNKIIFLSVIFPIFGYSHVFSIKEYVAYSENKSLTTLLDENPQVKCPFFPEQKEIKVEPYLKIYSYDVPKNRNNAVRYLLEKFAEKEEEPEDFADDVINFINYKAKPVLGWKELFLKIGYFNFDCSGPLEVDKKFGNLIAEDSNIATTEQLYNFKDQRTPCLIVMNRAQGTAPHTKDDFSQVALALARFHDRYRTGHGDIDRSNVFFDRSSNAVTFIDFDSMVKQSSTYSKDIVALIKAYSPGSETYISEVLEILGNYKRYFEEKNQQIYNLDDCTVEI